MEGLRGLAVFLVFLVHYATLVQPWVDAGGTVAPVLALAHRIGNAGVDLFFVLSGYLIYGHLIASAPPFGRYLRRRLQRIYPVFLVVFGLYLVLSFLRPGDSKLPDGGAAIAVYVTQNLLLLPGLLPIEPIITVAWSLSYEMFYYLAMPAVVVLFSLRRRTGPWRIGFFVAAALCGLLLSALVGGPVRLVMFLAGVLLHELRAVARAPGSLAGAGGLLLGLAAMAWPMPGSAGQALRLALMFIGFLVLCWSCFAPQVGGLARAFCWTPLRWLGNMSYSYYLIHGLTLKAVFSVLMVGLPPTATPDLGAWLLLPAFAVTLLPSALLFLAVERPFSLQPAARPRGVSSVAADATPY